MELISASKMHVHLHHSEFYAMLIRKKTSLPKYSVAANRTSSLCIALAQRSEIHATHRSGQTLVFPDIPIPLLI